MRVFAIGDTHLKAAARRNAARLHALGQIVAAIEQVRPDAVVWPGDLFHERSTIDDRNLLRRYLQAIAEVCPVVIVRGNHDAHGDLEIFTHLRARHRVHLVTEPRVVHLEHLVIACLPYPEEAALVAAGYAPADIPDAASVALDAIFMMFGGDLLAARQRGVATLFIGHANVNGAKASTGQPLVGAEIALRPEHLERLGATPKLLSHIHEPQDIHGATFIGSIAPMDWAEVTPRRYLDLAFADGEWVTTSRPIHVAALWHVEGVLTRDAFDWVVKNGPDGAVLEPPASWGGQEVRVRYRFAAVDAGLLDQAKAQILATFAEAAHLELEPVAIAEREVRAPQVVAARTLRDKLDAWTSAHGLPSSAGVQTKLAALEGTDAAALLAGIQARLQGPRDAVAA